MTREWRGAAVCCCERAESVRCVSLYATCDVGGNQREMDRAKAQKKAQAAAKKPKESAASLQKRREQCVLTCRLVVLADADRLPADRDAAVLREKQKVQYVPQRVHLAWTADIGCRKRMKRRWRRKGPRNNAGLGRVPAVLSAIPPPCAPASSLSGVSCCCTRGLDSALLSSQASFCFHRTFSSHLHFSPELAL